MECPFCQNPQTKVIDSRPGNRKPVSSKIATDTWKEVTQILRTQKMEGAPFRVRVYSCPGCGEKWGTVEVEVLTFRDLG